MFLKADFLEDFRNGLDAIRTISQLRAAIKKMAEDTGVSHIIYHLPKIPGATKHSPVTLYTYPEDWVNYYVEQRYPQIDPVVSISSYTILPTDWSSLNLNSRRVKNLFGEANEYGVGPNGMTIPLRGRFGESALFSFTFNGSESSWKDVKRAALPSLHVASYHVHDKVLELTKGQPQTPPHLSPREHDCLRLVACGMRDQDIAKILGITRRVVSAYVESMRMKLGSPTRANAVFRAVKFDMLSNNLDDS